jgi:hypothetical protein
MSHDPRRKGFGRWRLLGPDGTLGYSTGHVESCLNAVYPDAKFRILERHTSSIIFSVRKGFARDVRDRFLEKLEDEN